MICLTKSGEGADLLAGYLAKTLDPARTAELDRHIRECADCRGLASVWERLDEFAVPAVSPDFNARLYARIASDEARISWQSLRRWLWPPVAPLAVAAALAAVVLFLQVPGTPDAAKQVGKPDIEQVAQAVEDLDLLIPIDR